MKKQKISAQGKLMIILEGDAQSQYYTWRDRLLKHGSKVFDYGGHDKENERLCKENQDLKSFVGELTVELKKREVLSW